MNTENKYMNKNIFQNILASITICILTFTFTGCPPKEIKREEPKPAPPVTEFKKTGSADMFFRVANLDLKRYSKKIEKKDIERFAATMKKEKVDMLAVQTIVRYPGLSSRIDVYDELGKSTGMYDEFGETISLSGRQTGNAIFSTYPIHGNENIAYTELKSLDFEAALLASIDAGTRSVLVTSTRIPATATETEALSCLKAIVKRKQTYADAPLIILGNIIHPKSQQAVEDLHEPLEYNEVKWEQGDESGTFPFWFSAGDLQVVKSNVVNTDLGLSLVVEFKLIGQKPKE